MNKYLRILFFGLLLLFLLPAHADSSAKKFVLVIDAGHGGHDSGALGARSKEKDINLTVALAFGRLVEENCPDVTVVYTRRTDVFIPLQRRADIANNKKADLFISIHTNALPGGRIAYGSETYSLGMARAKANLEVAKRENSVITLENDYRHTYQGFDPNKAESYVIFEIMQDRHMKQSVDLAGCIQRNYKSVGRPDKGVHQAGFLVLRNTSMPSVLTELGFITTPAEEAYLNSARGVEELSRSIYNGFMTYRRLHDKSVSDLPAPLPAAPAPEMPTADTVAAATVTPAVEMTPAVKPETHTTPTTPKRENAPKPKAAPSKTQTANPKNNAAKPKTPNVEYRIQLGAGKRQISTTDPQFKGLKVTRTKEGDLFKYYHGSFTRHADAKKALQEVKKKIPAAYVVAFHQGKPVSVTQAKKFE